jgi:hypothetical protein
MNSRILQAMQARTIRPEPRWSSLTRTYRSLLRTTAVPSLVLATILCALGLALLWHHNAANRVTPVSIAEQPRTAPATPPLRPSPSRDADADDADGNRNLASSQGNKAGQGLSPDNSRSTTPRALARKVRPSSERRDISDATEAVSFPAPPLPLTQQERLLLQIARRSNPRNLASLTAAAEEAQNAQQEKQFQDFFKPPPNLLVQPQPPDPNLQDAQNHPQTQDIAATATDGGTK